MIREDGQQIKYSEKKFVTIRNAWLEIMMLSLLDNYEIFLA